ncbi:MAG: stalk domain-containing protein [Fimbriimonadaceae bacterium]|nr:stalk domain-containing protein [Fimbriimonadaceae bacterium]
MKMINKWSVALVAMATVAVVSAGTKDAKISIDRTVGSSTLTVKYSGASATLMELRLNGESLGTRTLMPGRKLGETNFTLNPADLKDGENEIEVRLFDGTGRVVGVEKSVILAEQSAGSAVYMSSPKVGQSVMGLVDVQIGFNATLKNSYVSYFVDGQFKGMTNYPPFAFAWDTTKETNGWHEVEAWAVDEASNTYKTRKVRIFVNNPSGRTVRVGAGMKPVKNVVTPNVVNATRPLKSVRLTGATVAGAIVVGSTPTISLTLTSVANPAKPLKVPATVATGQKHMLPTGTRLAPAKIAPAKSLTLVNSVTAVKLAPVKTNDLKGASNSVKAAVGAMRTATMLAIQKGTRLPNIGTFTVLLGTKVVNFDVAPRVENGVPMTPFRHLFEAAGGEVKWENLTKSVSAHAGDKRVTILIGDANARVNELSVKMESIPFLERGRTIVPMSFLRDALNVEIAYDAKTNHVVITQKKS